MLRISLVIIASILASACSDKQDIEQPTLRVQTFQIPETTDSVLRQFNGVARAHDLVDLSFRVDGKIASIPVNKGQRVSKGDLIAVLDKRDYQVKVDETKARMDLTYQQYQRAKSMLAQELMSQTEYDTMFAEYKVARANHRMAELALSYTELRAPFDGIVADVFLDAFVNVQVGTPVVNTHKTDLVEVEIQVPDSLLAVSRGREAVERAFTVKFEAYPELEFEGSVLELNLIKNPANRSYLATLTVPADPQNPVLEGMPASVGVDLSEITYTYSREYLIPVTAVRMNDGNVLSEQQANVWIYDPTTQTVSSRPVKLGIVTGRQIEVREGLEGGEIIVTNGANRLSEGQQVQLIEG